MGLGGMRETPRYAVSVTWTYLETGEVDYRCSVRNWSSGELIVREEHSAALVPFLEAARAKMRTEQPALTDVGMKAGDDQIPMQHGRRTVYTVLL